MAKFDKVRFMYLRSNFSTKTHEWRFDETPRIQRHPHTCVAIRVVPGSSSIQFSIARRESVGRLIWLKTRIQRIKELGGLVPAEFYQKLSSFRKNYTKKHARMVAMARIEQFPRTIENVDCTNLTAHTVARLVMENIASSDLLSLFEDELADSEDPVLLLKRFQNLPRTSLTALQTTPEYVRESAKDWLSNNVVQPETLPSIKLTAQSVR